MRVRALRGLFVATGLVLLAAACGDSDTTTSTAAPTTEAGHAHDHDDVQEVAADAPAPTVAIEMLEDPMAGWNLRIDLTDFRLAPERVSTAHVEGEGHMHLYIDGVKVTRLYERWHHLGVLEPGSHEVRVELSANNHATLTVQGSPIEASVVVEVPEGAQDHVHRESSTVEALVPLPSVNVEVLDDPAGGWTLRATPADFALAPERVSTAHVAGEGHMHLYIDGVKITRLYGEWFQLPDLPAGEHVLRVELSANDHSTVVIDGEPVGASVDLEVSAVAATGGDATGHGHSHDDAGGATRFDADLADAVQLVEIEVVDGVAVGGVRTIEVEAGSVVAVRVSGNAPDIVHVHGYDILRSLAPDGPAHFAFTAQIPGVFEVELEESGRLLVELEIS